MKTTSHDLYKLLTKDVKDWDFSSKFDWKHNPSGVSFWIGNGILFFRPYDVPKIGLNLIDTIRLWYWLKRARRQQLIERITNNN